MQGKKRNAYELELDPRNNAEAQKLDGQKGVRVLTTVDGRVSQEKLKHQK